MQYINGAWQNRLKSRWLVFRPIGRRHEEGKTSEFPGAIYVMQFK